MSSDDIYQQTLKHFLAPIESLLADDTVTEVMINGPSRIYFERRGQIYESDASFPDEDHLMAAIHNIAEYVNRHLDTDHHSMDARLPNGSRVHAIIPPSARQGPCLTIRKFQHSKLDLPSLVASGAVSEVAAEFLDIVIRLHKNIVISGGTGTGKTTMLNALSASIPEEERIVVIEDSSELRLRQQHTIYLEAQPARPNGRGGVTIRDLFVDSLRMRPDRIIVGEVRRGEALDLIQSMISGHAGSLTTVHANTPRDAASRLETLCLMSDTSLPIYVTRSQVASAVDLVVQLVRLTDGSRWIQSITELVGLESHQLGPESHQAYQLRELFRLKTEGIDEHGRVRAGLVPTGNQPTFSDEPFQLGLDQRVQLTRELFPRNAA